MKSKFLRRAEKLPQQHTSQFRGLDIIIEWPKGSIRVGENPDGTKWKREMHADYGYVRDANTVNDHEELDVYVGPDKEAENVYIVEQLKDDGELDEYKVMLGFDSLEDAKEMYLKHYPKDWEDTHLGGISEVPFEYVFDTIEDFKDKQADKVEGIENIKSDKQFRDFIDKQKTAKIVDGKRVDGWTGAETGLRRRPDYMEPGSHCREMNDANDPEGKTAEAAELVHPNPSVHQLNKNASGLEFVERRITAEESSFAGTSSPGLRIEAHQDNQTVGAIEIYFEDGNAYVRGITVAPEYRGQGIGQQLYDKAIVSAKQEGCTSFYSDKANCMSNDADKAWNRLRQRYKVEFECGEDGYDSTGRKKINLASAKPKCPHCGSDDYGLMPSDFETAKCNSCGKNWEHGIVEGINNPKTAAPVHDEMKARKLYHGTGDEAAAQAILQNGIQPRTITMPDKAKSRSQLAPVADRVYMTTDLMYAAIYALGGDMIGTGADDKFIQGEGQYGYIFEIDGSALNGDLVPDEDSIGEAVCALGSYRDDQELLKQIERNGERFQGQRQMIESSMAFHAKEPVCQPDVPDYVRNEILWFYTYKVTKREKDHLDEVAYQAQMGKRFQKVMSQSTAQWLLNHGAHAAHQGAVYPSRCWRFAKKDALNTSKANFKTILQEVPLPGKTASVTEKNANEGAKQSSFTGKIKTASSPWSVFAKVQRGFSMGKIIQPNKKA